MSAKIVVKSITLLEPRPEYTPDEKKIPISTESLIFNASRPLPGNQEWEGRFVHGIFYSEVCAGHPFTEANVRDCANLDGWMIIYASEEDFQKWLEGQLKEYGLGYDMVDADMDWRLRDQFCRERFGKEVEVEV